MAKGLIGSDLSRSLDASSASIIIGPAVIALRYNGSSIWEETPTFSSSNITLRVYAASEHASPGSTSFGVSFARTRQVIRQLLSEVNDWRSVRSDTQADFSLRYHVTMSENVFGRR